MIERLRRRADFLAAAAGGVKVPVAGFVLQARQRGDERPTRIGFTVSRKVGGAVERNRVRRRLREVVRLGAEQLPDGLDLVMVGRVRALRLTFDRLRSDFEIALRRAAKDQNWDRPRDAQAKSTGSGVDKSTP